tara:strand:- start:59 stop:931 length:873 start_codon:yes stop_codon:yes gene_type:complete
MGYKKFDLIDFEFVEVRFNCSNCGTRLLSEKIEIPELFDPDYHDKENFFHTNIDEKECPKCNKHFYVIVGLEDNESGFVEIENVEEKDIIEAITYDYGLYSYEEDQVNAILRSDNSIKRFEQEINSLIELNSQVFEKKSHKETIRRLIFSGGITCLEDYLSSTLIKEVIQDEVFFRNFVRTYKRINNRKFELGNIYDQLDNLYDLVKKELLDVIYHDLPKVKGMYKDSLEVIFPSIENLMKNIRTRHDIVHRNGKTKDGKFISLTKFDIELHLNEIQNFVINIQKQIEEI